MADPRALPGFGQVDLDLEDDASTIRPPAIGEAAFGEAAFGELDLGFDADEDVVPSPPASSSFAKDEGSSRVTMRVVEGQSNESTRIVAGDALSQLTKQLGGAARDGATRVGSLDEGLLAVARGDDAPPSSRTGNAPSGSGVATRDGRVAAMRDLYAKGDADGALALATAIATEPPPAFGGDAPDASIAIEIGEVEITDPFGGLIPVDDDESPADAEMGTAIVSTASIAPALAITSAREGVPRVVKAAGEIAKLPIDHRAGFLLAHIDGMQSVEEILDVCAMPIDEALELIDKLEAMGVIVVE